jgi:S-adenosylmethionine hydrolase
MPIVTLTTDWGNRDYYLASFKGLLASRCPNVQVIDVSNSVDHFDILQASFLLKNCYAKFPKGTIHFAGVRANETKPAGGNFIVVVCNDHYFLGYDNGIFSLTLDDSVMDIYNTEIPPGLAESKVNDRLAEIIARLAEGINPEQFLPRAEGLRSVLNSMPSFDSGTIRGTIIYIDSFQNIIANIPRSIFDEVGMGRGFSVIIRNHECRFKKISTHYSDAEVAEPVIMFNERGMLEFALNGANAAGLMGVKVLDNIRIEFHGAVVSPSQDSILPSAENAVTGN